MARTVSLFPSGTAVGPSRVDRASPDYRKAFDTTLRHGALIDLTAGPEAKTDRASEGHPTTHYIWRTGGDGDVRPPPPPARRAVMNGRDEEGPRQGSPSMRPALPIVD